MNKPADEEIGPARRVKRTYKPETEEGQAAARVLNGEPEPEASAGIFAGAEPQLETRSSSRAVSQDLGPQTEDEDDGMLLTRRPREAAGDTRLDIPEEYKRPGWDYQWDTSRVNGADVDPSYSATIYEGGWRPVLARSMPKLNVPGYTGKYVTRLGQILYTRPMHLTEEARAEAYTLAETQKVDKLMSASAVPVSRPGLMHSIKTEMSIEGVVGTHKAAPKDASA